MDARVPARYAVLAGIAVQLAAAAPVRADEARDLLQGTLQSLAAVTSVRADIEQKIEQAGITKHFSGRYVAADGKFRVELSEPSQQTIVHDGERLLWFIESRNTVWESTPTATTNLSLEPRKVLEITSDGYDWEAFRTKKLFGWVTDEVRYVLTPKTRSSFSKLELVIDYKSKRLIRVDLYDTAGKLQATQRFSHYVEHGDGCFPGEVAVTVWTPAGNVKSWSRYDDVVANEPVARDTFELDLGDDVAHETLTGFGP